MKTNCLITGCTVLSSARGLCLNHGNIAREKVKKGQTTWQELEDVGMARALKISNFGQKRNMFEKMFEEKVGELREKT